LTKQVGKVDLGAKFSQLEAFLNKLDPVAIIWETILGTFRGQRIEGGLLSLPSLFIQEAVWRVDNRRSHLPSPIAPGSVLEGRKKFLAAIRGIHNWDLATPEEKKEKRVKVIELLEDALKLYDHGGKVPAVRVCWVLLELVTDMPA